MTGKILRSLPSFQLPAFAQQKLMNSMRLKIEFHFDDATMRGAGSPAPVQGLRIKGMVKKLIWAIMS